MEKIKDYEKVQAFTERVVLPKGGYIGKILNAVEVRRDNYNALEISIDITDGDFKDHYKNDYAAQTKEDKKWRGVLRLFIPKEDGSEKDGYTKQAFKSATNSIEESNLGYHWDWNEKGLVGKSIGILIRSKEWEYNGKTGFAPEVFKFISVEAIKTGKFKVPDDKLLQNKQNGGFVPSYTAETTNDDYPF